MWTSSEYKSQISFEWQWALGTGQCEVHSVSDESMKCTVHACLGQKRPFSIKLINYKFHLNLENPNRPSTSTTTTATAATSFRLYRTHCTHSAIDLLLLLLRMENRPSRYCTNINFNNLENWLCNDHPWPTHTNVARSLLQFRLSNARVCLCIYGTRRTEKNISCTIERIAYSLVKQHTNCKCRVVKNSTKKTRKTLGNETHIKMFICTSGICVCWTVLGWCWLDDDKWKFVHSLVRFSVYPRRCVINMHKI